MLANYGVICIFRIVYSLHTNKLIGLKIGKPGFKIWCSYYISRLVLPLYIFKIRPINKQFKSKLMSVQNAYTGHGSFLNCRNTIMKFFFNGKR